MRLCTALLSALVVAACAKDPLDLGLARSALRALPALSTAGPQAIRAAAGGALPNDFLLRQFFRLQCHSTEAAVNNCPPGAPLDASTEYNAQALLGLIYSVDRETSDAFRAGETGCSAGEGAGALSCSPASFISADGGDAARYLLDTYALLGCVGHRTTPAMKYYAYSAGAAPRALVATRKHDLYTPGRDQSDVYQIYLSQNAAGENRLLAFNQALLETATGYSERVVLLVNFETRRFLVQYRQQGNSAFLTAAGTGGVSAAGAYQPGAFFVRTGGTSGSATPGVCIDNATRLQADPASCAAEQALWSGAGDVAAYLGATAAEQSDLAGFLAFFSAGPTARDLPIADAPAGNADVVNFPDRIQ